MSRLALLLMLALQALTSADSAAEDALPPYILVDALHHIQDDVAYGESIGPEAQREVLQKLKTALHAQLLTGSEDVKRSIAILQFALGGGDQKAASELLSTVGSNSRYYRAAIAAKTYVDGDLAAARDRFDDLELDDLGHQLAPYFWFAKATSNSPKDQRAAIWSYENVILRSPGSLLEEVSLRRIAFLAGKTQDKMAFRRAGNLYIRRYSGSPFAIEFVGIYAENATKLLRLQSILSDLELVTIVRKDMVKFFVEEISGKLLLEGKLADLKLVVSNHQLDDTGKSSIIANILYFAANLDTLEEDELSKEADDLNAASESDDFKYFAQALRSISNEILLSPHPFEAEIVANTRTQGATVRAEVDTRSSVEMEVSAKLERAASRLRDATRALDELAR